MRCGLIGRKLGHSFSPMIHAQLADYSYELVELEEYQIGDFINTDGFDAFNVTVPYKKTVIPFLDVISPEAEAIGAVNTVVRKNGKLYGYNTDYFGFSHMLHISGISVEGKKALVFGNGGASATVCAVLRDRGAGQLTVISRQDNTPENLTHYKDTQIIVNTTPVGMFPKNGEAPVDLSFFPLCEGVLDVIYNPSKTKLLLDAEARGIPAVNGLPMLVAQAIKAFELFVGDTAEQGVCEKITKKIENSTKNIILIGMPGCGKSTVGKLIAKKLCRHFHDADDVFTATYEVTPAEVIETKGEEAFRKMEHRIAEELGKLSGRVIACGGGVVTREYNYNALRQNGTVVFLNRKLENLTVKGRPLSASRGIETLYNERKDAYVRFSHLQIDSTEIPEKTADLIIKRLGM